MSQEPLVPVDDPALAGRFLRVARMLFGAICAALVVFVVVARVIVTQAQAQRPWERPPAAGTGPFVIFVALALVTAAAAPLVRRRLLPPAVRRRDGDPDRVPQARALRALGKYLAAQIVSWALCEAIGTYGLVLSIMTYRPGYALAFAAAAAANLVVYAPRKAHVQGVVDAVARATAGAPRSP